MHKYIRNCVYLLSLKFHCFRSTFRLLILLLLLVEVVVVVVLLSSLSCPTAHSSISITFFCECMCVPSCFIKTQKKILQSETVNKTLLCFFSDRLHLNVYYAVFQLNSIHILIDFSTNPLPSPTYARKRNTTAT